MVEYVMLSAESAIRVMRGWTTQLQPATVIPVLAVGLLVWMIWRTLRPR